MTGAQRDYLSLLFRNYPTACEPGPSGRLAMTVAVRDEDQVRPRYSRVTFDGAGFLADPGPPGPARLGRAVPVPAGKMIYGWRPHGPIPNGHSPITALVAVYNEFRGPGGREPVLSVLPLATASFVDWCVIAGHSAVFGSWFWQQVNKGFLINLAGYLRLQPSRVYWVAGTTAGSVCVVTRDVRLAPWLNLRAGTYLDHTTLRLNGGAPPHKELARCPRWTDITLALP